MSNLSAEQMTAHAGRAWGPTVWNMASTDRAEIATRNYSAALARVRRAEQEAELALDGLERAHREVVREARYEPTAELSRMFETGWNERRVRLLAEREAA